MAKDNKQLAMIDEIIKKMEKHNLVEVKIGDIHLKKEKPQDVADKVKLRELSEEEREEAKRIAQIRLKCPYPCPHWESGPQISEQKVS